MEPTSDMKKKIKLKMEEKMKKTVIGVIKLLLGTFLGLFVIFQFSENEDVFDFFEMFGLKRLTLIEIDFSNYLPFAIYVLASMIVVLILTYLIRFFTNTKNIKKTASVLNILIQLLLGIPITTMIYALIDSLIHLIDIDILFRICIGAIVYGVLFEGVCVFFEKAFYEKLKNGHKRCKLVVCNVIGDTSYEEGAVIVQKMNFEDCYSTMKNNGGNLAPKQFYKIIEMNWNNSKEVDSWRYYPNGDFIKETDEDLCKNLMRAEYAQKINWQG